MSFFDKVGHFFDEALGLQGKRQAQRQINDQIKAYKDQTELTRKQLEDTKNEKLAEKRRVEEKQIRGLRRNYSARNTGLLGQGQPASQDMTNQLGG